VEKGIERDGGGRTRRETCPLSQAVGRGSRVSSVFKNERGVVKDAVDSEEEEETSTHLWPPRIGTPSPPRSLCTCRRSCLARVGKCRSVGQIVRVRERLKRGKMRASQRSIDSRDREESASGWKAREGRNGRTRKSRLHRHFCKFVSSTSRKGGGERTSNAACINPSGPPARTILSRSNPLINTAAPPLSLPRMLEEGTKADSKTSYRGYRRVRGGQR
jgi:hypothetical protein